MRILLVHQYFKTPLDGGGIRSYYLLKGLIDAGHEVEVITAHNKPQYECEEENNISIHYLPVYYDNKLSFTKRKKAFLSFAYKAIRLYARLTPADLCYAISTPLTIGFIALWLKRYYKLPYVFEVGDLWPEAPIQLGVIKNPLVKRWLYRFEKKNIRWCKQGYCLISIYCSLYQQTYTRIKGQYSA